MPIVTCAGTEVAVTDEGFLVDHDAWTPEIAEFLAAQIRLQLTDEHWRVVTWCREDFAASGKSPTLRRISKLSGVGMKDLYRLFPKGPGKLAAYVAGLPKPQGCV